MNAWLNEQSQTAQWLLILAIFLSAAPALIPAIFWGSITATLWILIAANDFVLWLFY